MKRSKKILYILLLIIVLCTIANNVYAATCSVCNGTGTPPGASGVRCPMCGGTGKVNSSTIGDTTKESTDFIREGEEANSPIALSSMQDLSSTVYNILLILGVILAAVVGAILGIKFMTGSIEEQVDVKKALVPYVAGCVVIFGAFTIWKIVVTIIQG